MPEKLTEIQTLLEAWKSRVHARGLALANAQAQGLSVEPLKTLDLLLVDATQTLEAIGKALVDTGSKKDGE